METTVVEALTESTVEHSVEELATQAGENRTNLPPGIAFSVNAEQLAVGQSAAVSLVAGQDVEMKDTVALSCVVGQDAEMVDGFVGIGVIGQDLTMRDGGATVLVAGKDLQLTNGGAGFMTAGRDLSITNGGAGFVFAQRDVTVHNREAQHSMLLAGHGVTVEHGSIGAVVAVNATVADDAKILIELSPRKIVEAAVKVAALPLAGALLISKWLRPDADAALPNSEADCVP